MMDDTHQMACKHAILSIAGSDPSGGAGIQADLKTFSKIGVYGAAAITCLTAQNTTGVKALHPVPADFVQKQVKLVLDDLPVSHIKTGMIGTSGVARSLAEIFSHFPGEIICDPVLIASDGRPLLEENGLQDFLHCIVSHSTVLTPNIPELITLSNLPVENSDDIEGAVESLFARFAKLRLVLVTGGHIEHKSTSITDYLFIRNADMYSIQHQRHSTPNTHGTGCTFASAFTAFHILSGDDKVAFQRAVGFMDTMLNLSSEITIGKGCGPLPHHLYD